MAGKTTKTSGKMKVEADMSNATVTAETKLVKAKTAKAGKAAQAETTKPAKATGTAKGAKAPKTIATVKRPAPNFTLPASDGTQVSLKDYRGKKLVIYFYPQDNTPTCTQQACDFRDYNGKFAKLDVAVVGISPDELQSHDKFIAKHELPFLLLSDTNHEVAEAYGVWALKKLYGREYMGIVRSTFLIDEKGDIVKEWTKVRIKNHVQSVLDAIEELA